LPHCCYVVVVAAVTVVVVVVFVVEVRCSALPTLVDGRLSPASCTTRPSRYGTVCSLSCRRGYKLTGPSSRQCIESGKWNPDDDSLCVGQSVALFFRQPYLYIMCRRLAVKSLDSQSNFTTEPHLKC